MMHSAADFTEIKTLQRNHIIQTFLSHYMDMLQVFSVLP